MQPIITTQADLTELAARLAAADAFAVDTEFLRERTYRAELCLIQVATSDVAACVDPLQLQDLSALARPLALGSAVKVMHACRQDLEVLYPVAGVAGPVFDTQIAAALTGAPAQVGYADLVRRPVSYTHLDVYKRQVCAHGRVARAQMSGDGARRIRLGALVRIEAQCKCPWAA